MQKMLKNLCLCKRITVIWGRIFYEDVPANLLSFLFLHLFFHLNLKISANDNIYVGDTIRMFDARSISRI